MQNTASIVVLVMIQGGNDLSHTLIPKKEILFSRSENPYGLSWESWTIEWWNWLLSIPKNRSPVIDSVRRGITPHVSGDRVAFIAGNLGGLSERFYIIPRGKALFFPIINFTTSYLEDSTLKTESDLHIRANSDVNEITKVITAVDGVTVKNVKEFRVHSGVFDLVLKDDNLLELPPGRTKAISDGYWIFIKPLVPGYHFIRTFGSCSEGRTCVEIHYNIFIKTK